MIQTPRAAGATIPRKTGESRLVGIPHSHGPVTPSPRYLFTRCRPSPTDITSNPTRVNPSARNPSFFAAAGVTSRIRPPTNGPRSLIRSVADRPFDGGVARMARDQLRQDSCADIVLRNAIDGGGVVRYVYLSSGGTRVLVIDLDRRSCLKPQ